MYSFSRAWPYGKFCMQYSTIIWPSTACTVLYMVPRPPERPSQHSFGHNRLSSAQEAGLYGSKARAKAFRHSYLSPA